MKSRPATVAASNPEEMNVSTDAIVLLKRDHAEVKRLFREFHRTPAGDADAREQLAREMIELLTVHTYLENNFMYPEVRRALPETGDDVLEAYEEHHVADVLCGELWALPASDEHFAAKAQVLIETVERHIDEEEAEWFPKVRAGLGRKDLQRIGQTMLEYRDRAPRQPESRPATSKAMETLKSVLAVD
jgi:hemerythrin-like domain-containing protein